jgi:hypothetical protein
MRSDSIHRFLPFVGASAARKSQRQGRQNPNNADAGSNLEPDRPIFDAKTKESVSNQPREYRGNSKQLADKARAA